MSYRNAIARLEEQADQALVFASEAEDDRRLDYLVQGVVFQLRALRLAVSEAFAPEMVPEMGDEPVQVAVTDTDRCWRAGCGHSREAHMSDGVSGACKGTLWQGAARCSCPGFQEA